MKKILFPTDFSETARNAFVHALEFAKTVNAELLLVHTFELPLYDPTFLPQNYELVHETLQLTEFELFKKEIQKFHIIAEERNLNQIKMNHQLMIGGLLYNIKKLVQEDTIDFIVMGTSESTGWTTDFFGTNTDTVIEGVEVPILCVPLVAKYKKTETIGFTTRFRDKDKLALKEVLKIAKKSHAKIRCLYVQTQNSDVRSSTIKNWEIEFVNEPIQFLILKSDDVPVTILDFILLKEIDVLAMLTYKRNFFLDFLRPILTQKIAIDLNIPILVMHH